MVTALTKVTSSAAVAGFSSGASGAFLSGAGTLPTLASSSPAVTAGGAGPDYVPGFYLTLSCSGGTITLNGTTFCTNTVATDNVCDAATCWFNVVGAGIAERGFVDWSYSGVSVNSTSYPSLTLTVHVLIPTGRYTGSLVLILVPTHSVTVTIRTYVNYTTGWIPGEVEACAVNCSTEANAQTMTLWTNYTYTLTAVDLKRLVVFRLWNTTIGTLSSNASDPASVVAQRPGVIAIVLEYDIHSWSLAGYLSSPNGSAGAITAVSAIIKLPSVGSGSSVGLWVGIGSVAAGSSLWQAGLDVETNGTIIPFWEKLGVCSGCDVANRNYSMQVHFGDAVSVNVSVTSGVSHFTISDSKRGETWSGSSAYQPDTSSADWATEPTSGTTSTYSTFTSLMINGTYASLQNSYFAAIYWNPLTPSLTPSTVTLDSSGHVEFTLV